jgi:hypothetical protein
MHVSVRVFNANSARWAYKKKKNLLQFNIVVKIKAKGLLVGPFFIDLRFSLNYSTCHR